MHRVVIVGAGFAGLSAANALKGKDVDVTVVDQRNFHTFQPMLYEVATAGLESGDVAYPVRAIFGSSPNVTFRFAMVTGVDWDQGLVRLYDAEPLPFDSVIVASGATAKYFGIRGASQFSFPLYTLTDARRLRDHILRRLEAADSNPASASDGALTFVVVGGGPTGVEVAGALAELLDVAVRNDGFTFERSMGRIVVVDGVDRLLAAFKPSAGAYAAKTLIGRGVELKLNTMVKSVDDTCVELDDGSQIPTQTVVWAGGVTVEGTVASALEVEAGPNGRLVVQDDLSLAGRKGGYAVGDAAAVPWGPGSGGDHRICPQLAQVAIQSGAHAARQILNTIGGRPTEPFRYHDKGTMATIGRRAAITQFPRGLIVRGTLGWLAWLGLHIVYLIGFRNRIVVLVNWSWRYLSWGSGPRVIVGDNLQLDRAEGPAPRRWSRPNSRIGPWPGGRTFYDRPYAGTVNCVDDALDQIDRKVLQLFALVGESVAGATHALLSGDREAAKILADRDEVVDVLYHDIEQLTLEQLTVAGITSPEDLRFLVTVIRMLPDLERNGDLAEHVARRAARGLGGELSARSRGLVERMGEVAVHMWRATTDAYVQRLPTAASVVDTLDDEMDDLHVSLTVEVVAGTMPLPVAVELAMVARFYERFGDHAVNLAKRVGVLVPNSAQSA